MDREIFIFLCSADHMQDWQPYPIDPYSAVCDDHIHTHTLGSSIKSHERFLLLQSVVPPTRRFDMFPPDWVDTHSQG